MLISSEGAVTTYFNALGLTRSVREGLELLITSSTIEPLWRDSTSVHNMNEEKRLWNTLPAL
jgi:hypothetical protein